MGFLGETEETGFAVAGEGEERGLEFGSGVGQGGGGEQGGEELDAKGVVTDSLFAEEGGEGGVELAGAFEELVGGGWGEGVLEDEVLEGEEHGGEGEGEFEGFLEGFGGFEDELLICFHRSRRVIIINKGLGRGINKILINNIKY